MLRISIFVIEFGGRPSIQIRTYRSGIFHRTILLEKILERLFGELGDGLIHLDAQNLDVFLQFRIDSCRKHFLISHGANIPKIIMFAILIVDIIHVI